jgi:hypothetical protein
MAVDESFNALLLILAAVRSSRLRPPCAGSVHIAAVVSPPILQDRCLRVL